MYAAQNPIDVALNPVQIEDEPVDCTVPATWNNLQATGRVCFAFKVNYANLTSAHELVEVDKTQIAVIEGLQHIGGTKAISEWEEIPLSQFIDWCPEKQSSEAVEPQKKRMKAPDPQYEKLLQEIPWISWILNRGLQGLSSQVPLVLKLIQEVVRAQNEALHKRRTWPNCKCGLPWKRLYPHWPRILQLALKITVQLSCGALT